MKFWHASLHLNIIFILLNTRNKFNIALMVYLSSLGNSKSKSIALTSPALISLRNLILGCSVRSVAGLAGQGQAGWAGEGIILLQILEFSVVFYYNTYCTTVSSG
jgi:hypothetical protein